MTIHLDYNDIIALQTINQRGWVHSFNCTDLLRFNLIREINDEYVLTKHGKEVLNNHLPVLMCGQRMSEPLGGLRYDKKSKTWVRKY